MKPIDIEKLLMEFGDLPKIGNESTYLELCKYPYHRFEEICSRLLSFFMQPQNKHGLKDLFLRSLFEILEPTKKMQFTFDKAEIISEENAEGKRIDLLIYTDEFAIGIENKITAPLYNPLDIYRRHILRYSKNAYCVVFSLKKISDENELMILKKHSFANLTYLDFFSRIKKNLALSNNIDEKYLIFVNDFIQTIENMDGRNLSKEVANFFYRNADQVEEIGSLYEIFKNKIRTIQNERITYLKDCISKKTKSKWDLYEDWDLFYNEFIREGHRIGIESRFEQEIDNPLGKFLIYITTWDLNAWSYYEKFVLKKYPDIKPVINDGRGSICIEIINDNSEDKILSTLGNAHKFLSTLINK